MKQLLILSVKRCLFREKANVSITRSIPTREFSAITTLKKPLQNKSNLTNVYVKSRFLSDLRNKIKLMDLDVWVLPKLLPLTDIYNYFKLKALDSGFDLVEFGKNSSVALQLVCNLLSQLRFTDLEDLVTPYCKQEVQKNLMNWSKDWIPILAIKPELLLKEIPCEIVIYQDEKIDNKKWVEIRVIHYVWLKHIGTKLGVVPELEIPTLNFNRNPDDMYMFGVFNSKYVREFSVCNSDWTLSAINFMFSDRISFDRNVVQ